MLLNVLFEDFLKKNDTQLMSLNSISKAKGEYGAQSAAEKYDEKRPRYIRITDINEDGSLNDDCVASCNTNDDATYKLFYGDFLFARMGSVGKTYAFISGNQIFAGYLIRYQLDLEKIDPLYLLAFTKTKTFFNWVKLNQSGAIQPGINAKKYGELKVPVPTLGSQHILVNKIQQIKKTKATLQTMLEKLELLKKAKFKEMFGTTAQWSSEPLGQNATLINGRAYKQKELLNDGKYKILRVGNFLSVKDWYYSDMELEEDKYCVSGDLLYAWSASFGAKIWSGEKVIYHYHIWKIQVGEKYNKFFLCYLLNDATSYLLSKTHGIAMMHLTKEGMEKTPFIVPPLEKQLTFVKFIEKINAIETKLKKSLSDLTSEN